MRCLGPCHFRGSICHSIVIGIRSGFKKGFTTPSVTRQLGGNLSKQGSSEVNCARGNDENERANGGETRILHEAGCCKRIVKRISIISESTIYCTFPSDISSRVLREIFKEVVLSPRKFPKKGGKLLCFALPPTSQTNNPPRCRRP